MTSAALEVFLGVDPAGLIWCGRVVSRDDPVVPADIQWAGLRDVGLRLPEDERGILAEALALANWHRTHTRCPRCGTPTDIAGLGWWRTCPEDGSEHYPRTDPAVIALLVDDEGNALLGRQTRWPEGAFSTLAGFVEPGESAESAVIREVAEEVGLVPTGATYIGSQPWPFPASLMLGYHARIAGVRPSPHPTARRSPRRAGSAATSCPGCASRGWCACRGACRSPTTWSGSGTANHSPTNGAAGSPGPLPSPQTLREGSDPPGRRGGSDPFAEGLRRCRRAPGGRQAGSTAAHRAAVNAALRSSAQRQSSTSPPSLV